MKKLLLLLFVLTVQNSFAQQPLFMPQNIKQAYSKNSRRADGKAGKNYWQNYGRYTIDVTANPPNKTIKGTETISYINNSPATLNSLMIKLILNIHKPGAARQRAADEAYLADGIIIDKFMVNNVEKPFGNAGANTMQQVRLSDGVVSGDSVQLKFEWHFTLSEQSGREGKLDSTTFFLAYFYPRIAVMDDVFGWDRMNFTDAQEFYNDFNDYEVSVTVPKNYLVWGTGDLTNAAEVLQPNFLEKYNKSFTSNEVINIVTQQDLDEKNITTQNPTNTWRWKAKNVSDVAFCISDHYVWDATSVVVDKKTGRRASCQSAFLNKSKNFHNQAKHIKHSLDWFSNNWPGVPYPFAKSTIIQGFADMEYPMMANDSPQEDDVIQRFIAEHEIGHSYFPFYMGINEHRYGFMDEGWTTAFEYLIGINNLGKEKAANFFKQFRVAGWALNPSDESQIPIITPGNILSGQTIGNNQYGKPALAYLALKDMLGDDLFRKSLHGFMDRWNGKHPIPWDMFNSFSNLSGKDLNWFWTNWFFTPYYMDVAVENVVADKTGATITLKNIGGFAIPVDFEIEYSDGSKETKHFTAAIWEANQTNATANITTAKRITYLKADGGIFMDANEKDNAWGTKKINPADAAPPSAQLDKYLGTYSTTQIPLKITITKEDGKLMAQATDQPTIPLNYVKKDTFNFLTAGLEIIFNPAKNSFILNQAGHSINFTKEK